MKKVDICVHRTNLKEKNSKKIDIKLNEIVRKRKEQMNSELKHSIVAFFSFSILLRILFSVQLIYLNLTETDCA